MLKLLFWVKNLGKSFFWVNQLYNYFFGFIKCQVIFWGLELEKSSRNREKNMFYTQNLIYFLPIAYENFIITRVFRMI